MIASERDTKVLAGLAHSRMRSKIPELVEASTGRFTDHQAFLARVQPDLIMTNIPGISTRVADVICAETGADMT